MLKTTLFKKPLFWIIIAALCLLWVGLTMAQGQIQAKLDAGMHTEEYAERVEAIARYEKALVLLQWLERGYLAILCAAALLGVYAAGDSPANWLILLLAAAAMCLFFRWAIYLTPSGKWFINHLRLYRLSMRLCALILAGGAGFNLPSWLSGYLDKRKNRVPVITSATGINRQKESAVQPFRFSRKFLLCCCAALAAVLLLEYGMFLVYEDRILSYNQSEKSLPTPEKAAALADYEAALHRERAITSSFGWIVPATALLGVCAAGFGKLNWPQLLLLILSGAWLLITLLRIGNALPGGLVHPNHSLLIYRAVDYCLLVFSGGAVSQRSRRKVYTMLK